MKSGKENPEWVSKSDCLLIYDGECRLCVSMKQKLERLSVGHVGLDIRFLTYQGEAARKALGSDYCPGRPNQALFINASGKVLYGIEAFFPFIPHLPGGKFLLWCLRFSVTKRLVDGIYRVIARYRYQWFGEAKPVSQLD